MNSPLEQDLLTPVGISVSEPHYINTKKDYHLLSLAFYQKVAIADFKYSLVTPVFF